MLIWYKMMHELSYEHNRSKIRALHPKLIGKIYLELNCANLVLKSYINCGIVAVVMGIILNIIGKFLSTAQKHDR